METTVSLDYRRKGFVVYQPVVKPISMTFQRYLRSDCETLEKLCRTVEMILSGVEAILWEELIRLKIATKARNLIYTSHGIQSLTLIDDYLLWFLSDFSNL